MKWFLGCLAVVVSMSVSGCSEPRFPQSLARAASPSPTDPDLAKLQGTWRIESSAWNGIEDPAIAKSVTIVFEGDKFSTVDIDGIRMPETIKLMPDQNSKALALHSLIIDVVRIASRFSSATGGHWTGNSIRLTTKYAKSTK